MRIDGNTQLVAHLGYPTHAFKAPLIYNPYFASIGVNALVTPMGCRPEAFAEVLRAVFALENVRGGHAHCACRARLQCSAARRAGPPGR